TMKTFFTSLGKMLKKYNIKAGQFSFGVSEIDLQKFEFDLNEAINGIHGLNMTFHVSDFGDQLSLLYSETAHIDQVVLKGFYADNMLINPKVFSVVSGIAKIAGLSHFDMVFADVRQRSTENELIRLGITYAYGALYGDAMTRKDFLNAYTPGGGGDE
ncbi:MAG: hypothetical protein MJ072_04030, partial [Clostridia bacterium]|nr:hypothetical protein [Clostridia bacterium]